MRKQYSCNHTVIVGDLNQHLVARAFEELLTVYGLTNHVTFPTHISGSSLDPVISDLPEGVVTCRPLGAVGSSDHLAVFSTIHVAGLRDVPKKRTNWLWGKTNWEGLQDALRHTPWNNILTGDVDTQVRSFTSTIHSLQRRYVPTHTFTVKPLDRPWFGYNCRVAADEKSRAWKRFRRHPTHNNKQRHKEACFNMQRVQRVAQQRWQDELKFKLSDRSVGSKSWWTALKEQQGFAPDDHIPPLNKLTPLQHRRDVAGLCVTYKILKQGAPHLAILRQPWATPHPYSTRDANKRDQQLIVPFARTATFFRSFLPRYSRLWNHVVRQTDMHQAATLHIFKCAVNAWLMPSGHN
ncbi:hypothetical protein GWK47_004009 [Chionoecetes opilio]|uniref:Endonuclease/exonuclease/phosphatase domain-containing protein n=1 Tax=Chionoecetes opilio TaxID=41210 RepID=A0A8J4YG88_CHIOP|nr:hypothetical protein GWK47_004009 [Chionoecetes opilio]